MDPVYPNPKGITPQLDTDNPAPGKDMPRDISNAALDNGRGDQDKMDMTNPTKSDVIPEIHRIVKQPKPVPKGKGKQLRRMHRSLVISEN